MTLQNFIPLVLVFIAGVLVPPAVALNSILGKMLKSPTLSALVVMTVGAIFMVLLSLGFRQNFPEGNMVSKIPWFVWLGGIPITLYMIIMNYNVPKVGVGLSTSLVVAGQLVIGLIIDHFGLFGLPQASFSMGRFCGFLAIVGGVALLKFF